MSRAGGGLRLAACVATSLAAGPVAAAVLDIAPDGRVTVIDRPSVQLSADPSQARAITPAPLLAVAPRPPRTGAAAPGGEVAVAIHSAASAVQLDSDLIAAVAWQESRFHPDAVSPKGAVGVMQLMPATARALGVTPGDVQGNVRGGAAYLRALLDRYHGDLPRALAAYNAGPGAVDRHGGPPPYRETQAYVAAVLERLADEVAPRPTSKVGHAP